MKKQILFAFVFLLSFAVTRAQGPYTSAEFGVSGDSLFYTSVKVDTSTLNFALAGANTNWNFSTLAPTTQFNENYLTPANAGYRATFVAECVAAGGTGCVAEFNALTNLAFRDLTNTNIQGTVFTNVVQHDLKTATTLETNILGVTTQISGVNVPFTCTYNTPDVLVKFPVNYGNRDSSVSSYNINLTAHGYNFIYHAHNKRVNYADAYGTLVSPFATYSSTVRIRSYVLHTDTLEYNGAVIPIVPYTSAEFSWYNPSYIGPVFTASGTVGANQINFTTVTYLDTIHCLQPVAKQHHTPEPPVIDPSVGDVQVNFTNFSTNSNTYSWNFGDPSSGGANISTATNPSHTYNTPGLYTIEEIACNTACSPLECDTNTFTVNVVDSGRVRASFIVTPASPCIQDTATFRNTSINATIYFWNFGDQNTSTTKNPTHIYTLPGTYTVTLTVSNGTLSDTTTRSVVVNAQSSAQITASGPTTFCHGDSVTLVASGGTVYHWSTGHVGPTIKVKATGTFTVTATNSCGSAVSQPITVTVNTPIDTITMAGDTAICSGDSVKLIANTVVGATYQWRRNGQIIAGATTNTYWVKATGNYLANIFENQCEGVSNTIRVVTTAAPNASISTQGNTIVCSGDSLKLAAVNVAGATYQWQNNGVAIAGAVSRIYYAKIAGTYSALVNKGSCSSISNTIIVTGVTTPQPAVIATGGTSTCSGDSVALTTAGVNGYTYQWLLNNTAITGATSDFYFAAASGSYTVAATLNGCVGNSAATVITVNPSPTASAGNPQTITGCSFATITIGGNSTAMGGTGPYTYVWSPAAGLNDSVTGNPVVSQIGSTTNYNVLVTDSKGCTATSSVLITVTGSSLGLSVTASGDTAWCAGTPNSVKFTAVPGGGTSPYIYNWSPSADLSATNKDTTSANPTAVGVYNYNLLIIDHNGCQAGASVTVLVEAVPLATVTALDTTAPCQGDTVHFVAAPGAGYNYQWLTSGSPVAGATGANFDVVDPGAYSVSVTAGLCSATSGSVTVTSRPQPVNTIAAHGGSNICTGQTDLLAASGAGAGYSYQWYLNGFGIGDATSITYLAADSGAYYADITLNGCTLQSSTINIDILPYPADSVGVAGNTVLCNGDSVLLGTSYGAGYIYQWLLNGNYISNANDSTLTVSTTGNYSVIVNLSGCALTSTAVPVVVYQYPSANLTSTGNLTFCGGDSVTLNAIDSSDYNYQWFNNANGNLDSLPNVSASITVGDSGSYYAVISENICSVISNPVYVNELVLPTAGAFMNGDGYVCPGAADTISANVVLGYSYQWQKDGTAITGATAGIYTATDSGVYTVVETDQNNCSAVSNFAIVSYDSCTVDIPVISDNQSILVYPNPAHNNAVVSINTSQAGNMDLNLYDVLGNLVAVIYQGKTAVGGNIYNVPVSSLTPGVYVLRFYDGLTVNTKTIVKE